MIKVIVVDDSALIRSLLSEVINSQQDMTVVATASDPIIARDLIKLHNPDVITLDIEMPKMNGLDFLERLMRLRPMPVVMVSTLTERGSDITLRALELGAVDFVTKPKVSVNEGIREYSEQLSEKIRLASKVSFLGFKSQSSTKNISLAIAKGIHSVEVTSKRLIIVGASTGGTVAIKSFLQDMPLNCPGILITQHMPASFTLSFANRMNAICDITVVEAKGGEKVLDGHAYISPGDQHLTVIKKGDGYYTQLVDTPPVNRHKPSVDVLFHSAAEAVGRDAIGVILTGMGKDGAQGMLHMKNTGAYNFAQDEISCVVYGMPKEAVTAGGVDSVASLTDLPALVLKLTGTEKLKTRVSNQ